MTAPFYLLRNTEHPTRDHIGAAHLQRNRNTDAHGRQPTRGAIRTVEEVASALGLSRQRVQQLEASALRKLRASGLLRELANV